MNDISKNFGNMFSSKINNNTIPNFKSESFTNNINITNNVNKPFEDNDIDLSYFSSEDSFKKEIFKKVQNIEYNDIKPKVNNITKIKNTIFCILGKIILLISNDNNQINSLSIDNSILLDTSFDEQYILLSSGKNLYILLTEDVLKLNYKKIVISEAFDYDKNVCKFHPLSSNTIGFLNKTTNKFNFTCFTVNPNSVKIKEYFPLKSPVVDFEFLGKTLNYQEFNYLNLCISLLSINGEIEIIGPFIFEQMQFKSRFDVGFDRSLQSLTTLNHEEFSNKKMLTEILINLKNGKLSSDKDENNSDTCRITIKDKDYIDKNNHNYKSFRYYCYDSCYKYGLKQNKILESEENYFKFNVYNTYPLSFILASTNKSNSINQLKNVIMLNEPALLTSHLSKGNLNLYSITESIEFMNILNISAYQSVEFGLLKLLVTEEDTSNKSKMLNLFEVKTTSIDLSQNLSNSLIVNHINSEPISNKQCYIGNCYNTEYTTFGIVREGNMLSIEYNSVNSNNRSADFKQKLNTVIERIKDSLISNNEYFQLKNSHCVMELRKFSMPNFLVSNDSNLKIKLKKYIGFLDIINVNDNVSTYMFKIRNEIDEILLNRYYNAIDDITLKYHIGFNECLMNYTFNTNICMKTIQQIFRKIENSQKQSQLLLEEINNNEIKINSKIKSIKEKIKLCNDKIQVCLLKTLQKQSLKDVNKKLEVTRNDLVSLKEVNDKNKTFIKEKLSKITNIIEKINKSNKLKEINNEVSHILVNCIKKIEHGNSVIFQSEEVLKGMKIELNAK